MERNWKFITLMIMVIGFAVIILGITANPFFIERFISSDGNIEDITFRKILIVDGILVLLGILLIVLSRYLKTYSEKKGKILSNFLTLCGSLLFTLILIELALQFVNKFVKPFNRQRHSFFEYHDRFGWKHRPNKTAYFKNTKVEINSKGLRDDEVPFENPKGESRILFLGDSQLFGDGMPEDETFATLLESRFDSLQVINSGVIGYGNDQQFLYLKEEGFQYNPNIIFVTINALDFQDNISKTIRSGYSKPVFEVIGNQIQITNVPVPKFDIVERIHRSLKNLSHLYYYGNLGITAFRYRNMNTTANSDNKLEEILPKGQDLDRSILITKKIMREIALVGRQSNIPTVVTYLPYILDFESGDYQKKVDMICQNIDSYSKENNFYFLDIRSKLLELADKNIFLDKVHLNKKGHKLVAEIMGNFIINQKLLP